MWQPKLPVKVKRDHIIQNGVVKENRKL